MTEDQEQNIRSLLSKIINAHKAGDNAMNYGQLATLLVETVKEQQAIVDAQRMVIDDQRIVIDELQELVRQQSSDVTHMKNRLAEIIVAVGVIESKVG